MMRMGKPCWFFSTLMTVLVIQLFTVFGRHDSWGAEPASPTIVINRGIPFFTTDVTPRITGASTASPGSRITVTINGTTVPTTVLPGGTWVVDWPETLTAGTYRISATVTDAGGKIAKAEQTLTVGGPGKLPRRPLVGVPEEFNPAPLEESADADFQAMTDRWRIVPPPYEVNVKGSLWDPYNQNLLKGDLPIYGQDVFLNLTGTVDTLVETRTLPTPSNASSANSGEAKFFGNDFQFFLNQNMILSTDLFKGDTAFKPFDWRFKATLVGNINFTKVQENGILNADVRNETERVDGIPTLQEGFVEYHIADLSPNYDFISIRAGIQPLNSDFKGFVFSDTTLGVRLFGSYESNRDQFNLAYFDRLEKDTNSGLNRLRIREQQVLVANFFRQDFLVPGYTTQFSIHQLFDGKSFHFDQNNFLARPDPIGSFTKHSISATYFGWASFGHFGRINVDHAFYYVLGHDTKNPLAGRSVDIGAYMGALELSFDRDWLRPKVSYFHSSGDDSPLNGNASGFDAIFDNPLFAGGGFSFWNRQGIKLTGTGVNLVSRGSLLPDIRSSKEEGQPNFVNPGLHLFNVGVDAELTPKLKGLVNVNYLRFDTSKPLQILLFQSDISDEIGWDLSLGFRYRPFLNNNVFILAGSAVFFPGKGFRDIFGQGDTLFHSFSNITLTF